MKKIFALILLSIMIMSFSVSALTSPLADAGEPIISNLETYKVSGQDGYGFKFKFEMSAITYGTYTSNGDKPAILMVEYSINGGEWKEILVRETKSAERSYVYAKDVAALNGKVVSTDAIDFKSTDSVKVRLCYGCYDTGMWLIKSNPSNELTLGQIDVPKQSDAPAKAELICSDWAKEELAKAEAVIPESLKTADLTKNITRAEFAAVAVKAYEALKGTKAQPVATNPFKDTNDLEVLKAYNIGITTGTSETTFEPTALLNREQAATMLTRAYSKEKVEYEKPATFADDNKIDDWAQDSVYFMASKGIINGVGDNKFAPDDNCSREQAIIIAARMVANLK